MPVALVRGSQFLSKQFGIFFRGDPCDLAAASYPLCFVLIYCDITKHNDVRVTPTQQSRLRELVGSNPERGIVTGAFCYWPYGPFPYQPRQHVA